MTEMSLILKVLPVASHGQQHRRDRPWVRGSAVGAEKPARVGGA